MKVSPSTPWSLSSRLKRAQLQQVATLIGAPLTGTKPQLVHSIDETCQSSQRIYNVARPALGGLSKHKHELRVMSIDMGIRNLAFAFLTSSMTNEMTSKITFEKPALHQWKRVNLMGVDSLASGCETNSLGPAVNVSDCDVPDAAMTAESFEPSQMAVHAYNFAKYCASLKPTHILIERQRFRSSGHSAVQEWSLRVGMLEAMLYATIRTLTAEGLLTATTVEPMLPMRVNKYWFKDQDIPATGKQAKLAKIAIVSDMLQALNTDAAPFSAGTDVVGIVESFGVKPLQGSAANKVTRSLNKLDDMSDALLQGLAWLEWQQNRLKLIDEGPDGLGIGD